MMKRLEIDGRIVTVYPKKIEVNGSEVVTQGDISIELMPDGWGEAEMAQPDFEAIGRGSVSRLNTGADIHSSSSS